MRLRWSLRTLMAAVIVLALLCLALVRLYDARARSAISARMALQERVTNTTLFRFRDQLQLGGHGTISSRGSGSFADNPAEQRWSVESKGWSDRAGRDRPLFRLKVEGGAARRSLSPIVVTDLGASLNGQAIERLTKEYRERGWPYRVVVTPGVPASGPPSN